MRKPKIEDQLPLPNEERGDLSDRNWSRRDEILTGFISRKVRSSVIDSAFSKINAWASQPSNDEAEINSQKLETSKLPPDLEAWISENKQGRYH